MSRLPGNSRIAVTVLLVSGLGLSACAGDSGGDDSTYQVGVLYDLSQTYSFIGEPALAGLKTAIHAINEDGGVAGRDLELVVKDDRSDPTVARTAYQELANEGVVAVVGPNASATLSPVAPLAEQFKVPNLSLAAISDLHGEAQPYLYATGLHVAESARIDATWIDDTVGADAKVAGLSLDTPSVAEFRESLEEVVPESGGELVANDVVAVDATDMSNAVLPIAEDDPDVLAVGLLGSQLPGVVSNLRDRGLDAPVINYFVASDDATFEAVDDPGFYAVRHFAEPSETNNPGVADMVKDAEAAGEEDGMTSAYFTHGYVTGMLLAKALEDCGEDCDGEGLDTALSGIEDFDTNGLSGPLGVTDEDHYFVKYGRVFGWNDAEQVAEPQGDWMTGE